jgi:hypothetical protein
MIIFYSVLKDLLSSVVLVTAQLNVAESVTQTR